MYNDSYQEVYSGDGDPVIRYTSFGRNQNLIQWELDCCGVNGAQDYTISTEWPQPVVVCRAYFVLPKPFYGE